jgi:hypothetical protein
MEDISLSVNLYWIQMQSDLEIKSESWSYGLKNHKSQPLRVNGKARSHVATINKSKRSEVATINIVQAQVEEMYFIFNIECRHELPIKSQYSRKPKNPSEISEIQWSHTLHISLNQGKSDVPVSQTRGSILGCNDYISNFGCSSF